MQKDLRGTPVNLSTASLGHISFYSGDVPQAELFWRHCVALLLAFIRLIFYSSKVATQFDIYFIEITELCCHFWWKSELT